MSLPTFIIPGVIIALMDKGGLVPKAKVPKTILELSVIAFALWTAPPMSCALFP